jgi:hypothetical protein
MVLVEQSTSACGAGTELLDSAAGFSLEEDGCSGPGLLLDVTVELLEPVTTLELLTVAAAAFMTILTPVSTSACIV